MERSASGVTVVDEVPVLLPGTGSPVAELTVAELFRVAPSDGAVTLIVMSGAAPGTRLARVQVTVPEAWLQFQPVPVALTKPTPTGSVSATLTELAVLGPPLATCSV